MQNMSFLEGLCTSLHGPLYWHIACRAATKTKVTLLINNDHINVNMGATRNLTLALMRGNARSSRS